MSSDSFCRTDNLTMLLRFISAISLSVSNSLPWKYNKTSFALFSNPCCTNHTAEIGFNTNKQTNITSKIMAVSANERNETHIPSKYVRTTPNRIEMPIPLQ